MSKNHEKIQKSQPQLFASTQNQTIPFSLLFLQSPVQSAVDFSPFDQKHGHFGRLTTL
jgi:hypothetical protein